MPTEDTFADLISRVRSGDPLAAEEVVRLFEPQVRTEVRVRLRMQYPQMRRQFDSADICQSVLASFFVRAAAGQYDLDDPRQLQGLLVRMAQNKLSEQVRYQLRDRRDARRVGGDADAAAGAADPEPGPGEVVASRDLLAAVLVRLGPEERRISDLRCAGREWAEVAAELGGTAEGRRKQFSRAVDRVLADLGLDRGDG